MACVRATFLSVVEEMSIAAMLHVCLSIPGSRLSRLHGCLRFLGPYLKVELPGHVVTMFNLQRNRQTAGQSSCPITVGSSLPSPGLAEAFPSCPHASVQGVGEGYAELENAPRGGVGSSNELSASSETKLHPRAAPSPTSPWLLLAPSAARPAHLEGMW